MNINLIYQNNSYNFDIRKDISINYLENLASKLIDKDKSSFELLYKDNILSQFKNSLLKEIVKNDSNISIIISSKFEYQQLKSKKGLPKLKIFNNSVNTENNEVKNNLLLNDTEISKSFSENSIKVLQSLSKHNFRIEKNKYTTQNKVFEEIYNTKDNEIFSLMKNLSQKIKEYDNMLFKKYKNSCNKNNNELIIFEKNIIDFKDKQIQFMKKLLNLFDEKDFSFNETSLEEFYKELDLYYNKDYIIQYKKKIEILEQKLLSINLMENKSKTINNELPLLINKTNKENKENKEANKIILSEKKKKKNININKEEDKKEKPLFFTENKKNRRKAIYDNNSLTDNIQQSIIIQDKNIFNSISINKSKSKKNYLNKQSTSNTTKANTNPSENSISSKPKDKINKISQILLEKKLDNINNNNNKETKNNENNNNNTTRNKKKSDLNKLYKRINTIQNVKYNRNKVSTLFEISESKGNEYKEDSNELNSSEEKYSNEYSHNDKKDISFDENDNIKKLKVDLNKRNKPIYNSLFKNSKIGYLVKSKNRKVNQRVKKMGTNINDFLI